MKILVVNGPNINMLGKRELEIYGHVSLDNINDRMKDKALKLGVTIFLFQSNYEGEIVDIIHDSINSISGLIINPAGYTHTSVVIRDALLILKIPVIEVHLSNIYARESFRKKSMISDIVSGNISGLGIDGYLLALEAIVNLCK